MFHGAFGVFSIEDHVIYKQREFYFFFSGMNAFYFFFLRNCSKTLSTMLNRSGEDEHPCHVSDSNREAFSLSPLSMTLAVGLS